MKVETLCVPVERDLFLRNYSHNIGRFCKKFPKMKFYNTNNKSDYQLGILKLYSYALKMAGVLLWSPMVVPIIGEDEVTSIWLVALPA
jgi:hypothetical protein